ncbi:MAG: four helix bundle protein [Pseudomonadota bacterium]
MSGEINSYRDLKVWREGMALAEACYFATRSFPREELFGLTSQIRRSVAAIPANIAEGQGRETSGAFVQFLRVSQGSLKELETHLLLAGRVGLMDDAALNPLLDRCDELGRMLRALIRSIQGRSA